METCGQEDAVSDINGPVGEGGNEELIPAWGGRGSKGQEPELRPWDSKHIKEREEEVARSASLAPLNVQGKATGSLKVRRPKRGQVSRDQRDSRSLTCP